MSTQHKISATSSSGANGNVKSVLQLLKSIQKSILNFIEIKFVSFEDATLTTILLTSLNNQISEFRIPNIYNEIFFILFFTWSKVGTTVSSAIYNPL